MVRAAVMERVGGPAVMEVQQVEPPRPGPTQVVVEVAACGLCGHDQADRMGLMKIPLPAILGHEIAGTVIALGAAVTDFSVGDRVAARQITTCGRCDMCRSGQDIRCPDRGFVYGGLAEHVAVDVSALTTVPDHVSFVDASVVGCALGTVHQALHQVARIAAGEHVVVTGAGGGLGLHAVMVARALGATPIALTGSSSKVERLRASGAAHVVTTESDDYWREIVEVTGGCGADVVLDNVGHPDVFKGCFRALGHGARYVFTGQVAREKIGFYPRFLFAKEVSITGSATTSRSTLEACMRLVADGSVTPVTQTYPLDAIQAAFEDLDERRVVGRAVLLPATG